MSIQQPTNLQIIVNQGHFNAHKSRSVSKKRFDSNQKHERSTISNRGGQLDPIAKHKFLKTSRKWNDYRVAKPGSLPKLSATANLSPRVDKKSEDLADDQNHAKGFHRLKLEDSGIHTRKAVMVRGPSSTMYDLPRFNVFNRVD